jgi:hypothetical protein
VSGLATRGRKAARSRPPAARKRGGARVADGTCRAEWTHCPRGTTAFAGRTLSTSREERPVSRAAGTSMSRTRVRGLAGSGDHVTASYRVHPRPSGPHAQRSASNLNDHSRAISSGRLYLGGPFQGNVLCRLISGDPPRESAPYPPRCRGHLRVRHRFVAGVLKHDARHRPEVRVSTPRDRSGCWSRSRSADAVRASANAGRRATRPPAAPRTPRSPCLPSCVERFRRPARSGRRRLDPD